MQIFPPENEEARSSWVSSRTGLTEEWRTLKVLKLPLQPLLSRTPEKLWECELLLLVLFLILHCSCSFSRNNWFFSLLWCLMLSSSFCSSPSRRLSLLFWNIRNVNKPINEVSNERRSEVHDVKVKKKWNLIKFAELFPPTRLLIFSFIISTTQFL